MTTTELGINVGTGQSEEELNKLADSMDNVLAKFIKVMETAGRSEEAFQKIAGAIGIHQTKLKAMTDDVKKASMVLGPEIAKTNDMTIRGLSTNITKQFNKLSRDISAVFSLIPQELKKSTQEIANMTVAINNNLGGIRVQAKEAADAIMALVNAGKKLPKIPENNPETSTTMWGKKYNRSQALMEADAWDEAVKNAKKYQVEQAKIRDKQQNAPKQNTSESNMWGSKYTRAQAIEEAEAWDAAIASQNKAAALAKKTAKERAEASSKDLATRKQEAAERLALEEATEKSYEKADNEAQAQRKKRAEDTANSYKEADDEAQAIKKQKQEAWEELQRATAQNYAEEDINARKHHENKRALEKQEIAKDYAAQDKEAEKYNSDKQKAAAQQARNDRKERFNTAADVNFRSEDDTVNYISEVKAKTEAVAKTLAEARSKGYIDVEEIKKVQTALTEVNKETKRLREANIDMSGDAGRAMTALSTSVNDVNKDFKTLRDTSKIGFMESLGIDIPKVKDLQSILKEISGDITKTSLAQMDLGDLTTFKKELVSIRDAASDIGAKNEKAAAEKYLKVINDQITASELLNKEKDKEAQHNEVLNKEVLLYEKVKRAMSEAKDIADKLSSKISGIDTGVPMFQDLQGIQETFEEIKKVKESLKETIVQARKLDDPAQLADLQKQLKDVLSLEDKIKNAMKGMHPTEVGGISDPTITQFRQEIELLDKIKISLDRVTEARKRLADSAGHKGNTEAAKKELADAKADADQYYDLVGKLKRDLSSIGVKDSEAVRSLQKYLAELNKEIGSFDGQIKGTEKSFKNLWGAATMAMGKFLLYYHTAGVVVGMVRGTAQGLMSTIDGMMRISEPVTNLEKALRMLNETGGGIEKTRQEMKYFKDTANQLGFAYKDLAEGYKQFKDIADRPGGNYQGVMNIWKEMTAAARATGQSGDLQDFYKGFTDAIGKGQIMTEELKKQLAQRLPGLIKGVEKEIAAFRNIDASKFNIFTAMEKGTVKLSEFMAAFENFLPKWSKLGESMGDAYSASISRLSNAWTDLMTKIVTGPTGSKVIDMIEDMVSKLKDDDVAVVFERAAASITNVARVLMDIAANIIPQIGRSLRSLPFLNMDAKIAAANPKVTQGAVASVNKASEFDILYSSQQLGGFLADLFGGPIKRSSQRQNLAERFSSMYQTEGIGDLFAQGWISAGASKGSLKIAKDVSETVGFEFDKRVLETSEGMSTKVFDPILNFLIAVDGDMSKLNAKIEQARQAMYAASGGADALGIEATYQRVMTSDWTRQTASGVQIPINFGSVNQSLPSVAIPKSPSSGILGSSLVSALLHGNVGQIPDAIKATPGSYTGYDTAAKEDTEAESKLKAFQKGLETIQDEINKASMGKWAYEFSQITHRLKELEIELGDKAAPQIKELGEALRKDFLKNFSKGIEDFDMSLDQKIRSGKYGKELQTSTDTILKEYRDNKQKIEEEFRDVSLIPGASEEDFAKVKQFSVKVEEARRASFENVLDEAVMTENTIAEARISGAEATVKKIAAIRNNETKDVIDNLKTIINETDRVSGAGAERRIADIEKAGEVAKKEGMDELEVFRQVERMKQAEIDKTVEHRMNNSGSFTEYLNIRLAKEQGLFDNNVVATQKQFEKMYEAVGGGAVEMGTTIEKSFTDAFTGTLKSWGDVWKEIQAIFLKTLAAMIWESKARPIVISAVSAFTGVAPALAGGSTQGNIASQAHDFVTGGSQSGGGIFSMFSKGMDKLTASVDTFGHSVLKFSEGVKLSSAIGYGALGYGIGYGVGGTATTGIGGALGGMAGNIAGSMVGQAFSSTLGATLSEAMPGIGALVGTALGTAISGVFSSVKKITDQGLRIVIGSTGAVFADSYTTTKKSSLFTSSTSTSYSTADHAVIMELNRLYKQSTQNIDKAMQVIGLSSTTSGFSLGEQNISWQGKEPKDVIEAWVKDTMSSLTNYVMGKEGDLSSFNTFKRIGEDSADTLLRLSEGLEALTENAVKASVEIGNLAGGLSGLNLASYASDLKDALGGDDGLSSFFGRIKNFIGYAGTTGIANIAKMNSGLDDSLKKITNLYNSRTNATNITQLQKQLQEQINIRNGSTGFSEDSALSKSWSISFSDEITAMLSESTKEALKKATEGRYNDSLNNLAFKAKDYEIVSTILKDQNKEAWYAFMDRVEEYTNGWTGVNENTRNYLQASISIDRLTETIEKAQSGVGGAELFKVSPTSSTFWTDYQKALNDPAGLSPELAAAWDSAAKFAEDIASVRDQAEEARKAIEEQNAAYNRQREILAESAVMLGASSDALMDLSYKAQGMNQNDLPEWFAQIGDITASKLIPGLDGFIRTGETALDTIVRLTEALKATHDAAGVAGISLETISGSTRGIDIANYAQGLVDYFGSQDSVNSIFSTIGDAIYDDDGLNTIAVNYWKAQATAQAEALGTSLDAAKDFLKDKMSQTITDPALLNSYAQLATSINNMETAADSASGSVDSLADYLDEIRDKIKSLGMTDTESFLFDLQKEIEDMKKEILSRGGTESDTALADAYGVAAISNKLSESMDEVYASIRKLTTPDLIEQINQLSDSYWEQTQSAILLGASQEELNAILYNSYLQAKEVLKSAAQAYVQAYDDTLSQIEELKSKQQALEDDVADARNDYMASLQKEIDAKQEAIDALQENVDKLKDFVDNLKDLKDELATTAGFLSPTDKVGSTLSQFQKTASLAQAGNEDAMGSLSDKAKSALTAAESGSYQEYINTFVQVYGTVNSLQEETKKKYDPQKEQLDTLIASRDSLQSIYDQLKEDADITKSIADAQETYFKAQQDLSASTYKTQIDSLQQEVDQHEETVELLRSQYDTTMSLLDASLQYFEIQKRVGEILVDSTVSIVDENVKRRTYDKVYSTLTSLEEYLTPEVTKDGTDSGIKTIVSATSIKDGVLLAIRSSNDTDTVPATSLIGLLNTIKTNTTAA